VLIGTADDAYLPPVPAARHSLARMRAMLTSGLCGWPADRVRVFADPAQLGDLPDELVTLFRNVTDVALFYYVGHGQIDPQDQLCLSLTQSQADPARRKTTSLAFEQVRHALWLSQASTKILILDCCYAGLAAPGTLGADDMLDLTRAPGTYTLAAAGEFSRAWFETGESAIAPQTYFTKYLLDVIEQGILGEGPDLMLERIFDEATDALARDGRPVPTSRATGRAPRLVFARNAAAGEVSADGLPPPQQRSSDAADRVAFRRNAASLRPARPPAPREEPSRPRSPRRQLPREQPSRQQAPREQELRTGQPLAWRLVGHTARLLVSVIALIVAVQNTISLADTNLRLARTGNTGITTPNVVVGTVAWVITVLLALAWARVYRRWRRSWGTEPSTGKTIIVAAIATAVIAGAVVAAFAGWGLL